MKRYTLGFVISIILTLLAYFAVVDHWLSGSQLALAIVVLALVQLCVQLVFFLHLDSDEGLHWNLAVVVSTAGVVLILVVGTLWIMNSLKYRHETSSADTNNFILENEAIRK